MKYGPALFGLSWDSGELCGTRAACPIYISVGNTNHGGRETVYCIGYMPWLDVDKSHRGSETFRLARHHMIQEIIGAIGRVMRSCAAGGFECRLPSGPDHAEESWTLQPILVKMELDGKERYKFFALSNERSCGICSGPRKGRSSFRAGTKHADRKRKLDALWKDARARVDSGCSTSRDSKKISKAQRFPQNKTVQDP